MLLLQNIFMLNQMSCRFSERSNYTPYSHMRTRHTHSCSVSMWGPIYFVPPGWGRVSDGLHKKV